MRLNIIRIIKQVLYSDFDEFDYVKRFYNLFRPYESILFTIPISKKYSFDAPTRFFSELISPIYCVLRNAYRRCSYIVSDYNLSESERALRFEWKEAQCYVLQEFYKSFDKKRVRNDLQYLSQIYN